MVTWKITKKQIKQKVHPRNLRTWKGSIENALLGKNSGGEHEFVVRSM